MLSSAKKNVLVLALCQAFFNSSSTILVLTAGLVGYQFLGEDTTLATVPASAMVIGTAIATMPASWIMQNMGRRGGFTVGALVGLVGAIIAAVSVWQLNFWAFSAGILLIGMYNGFAQLYRFAAADVADEAFRPKAISLVLAGGLAAAFLGPEIALRTINAVPGIPYLGSYLAIVVLVILAIISLQMVDIPPRTAAERRDTGRPLSMVMRQPIYVVAVMSSMIGFGVMSLVMTATPIAMVEQFHHTLGDAKFVIQWHVVAMFGPSFFTGSLITRFGVLNVVAAGIACMVGAITFAVVDTTVLHFWSALFLLGLGWNFMFVGGSTLLTRAYAQSERIKVQASHDFLVFGTVAVASLSSGALLQLLSWRAVGIGAVPFLVLAAAGLACLALQGRAAPPRTA